MAEKARVYGESYPLDEDFLAALEGMPAAATSFSPPQFASFTFVVVLVGRICALTACA